MHIALITGGENTEREVSLRSAKGVEDGLQQLSGYTHRVYTLPEDYEMLQQDLQSGKITCGCIMIHGKGGEDGEIATLLDAYNVPYQSTSPDIATLTMDKDLTKKVWRKAGIPVGKDVLISPAQDDHQKILAYVEERMGFPCVLKLLDLGSSQGVHIVQDAISLEKLLLYYASHPGNVLIEEFISGREITISLLDQTDGTTQVLPLIEIVPPQGGPYNYKNKYNGETKFICPPDFDTSTIETISSLSLRAYQAVACTKYARIDAILTDDGPVFLEINTIPGFTKESLFPVSAKAAGYSFPQLIEHLLILALQGTSHAQSHKKAIFPKAGLTKLRTHQGKKHSG